MPAVSQKQKIAANIARAVQKGEVAAKPGSASAQMAKMKTKSLKHFMKTKKGAPKKKPISDSRIMFGKPTSCIVVGSIPNACFRRFI